MQQNSLAKAGILMLILVTASLVSWELYVRSKGYDTSFDDGPPLWANKRAQVYEPADKSTVFIGSSRIKFDLDIPTWEGLTGDHAVQLACVGSSPLPVLEDLANDVRFKGKLVIDVTEILFFSLAPPNLKNPKENIKYYKEQTPAQKVSFQINRLLESKLAFLDKDRLSLNAMLDKVRPASRKGVFVFPLFADGFGRVKYDRQEYMTEAFVADTNQQNIVRGVWKFLGEVGKEPPPTGGKLDTLFNMVKANVDKIRARGGKVIFVRTPSSGPFLAGENMGFPREKYWEQLLKATGTPGIHFADYPVIDHFQCPEFSHLSMPDAVIFTKEFIRILAQEKGWSFAKMPAVK
ncbi:MAG: hypothetical protein IPI66_06530 [Chitinophagaceae bacterium]|nr:hypothetical protein [Chitinophagaceae bacterium]MBL0055972.1 hypothetical protein [Chitinophagaceae bacterium]